ncbi:PaaI family thioesterase [bacterium]|jgi:acyl-coenzyme A thioesterase PaaI-like protein|nr:PaaI family thioesterase [bacterium]
MTAPFLLTFDMDPSLATRINPAFPEWEKSFVSGPESRLFEVSHFLSGEDPHLLLTKTKFLPHAEGPPGHVHGGATAGLLDEVMGVVVWHHHYKSVTQSIQVHYRKAIPMQTDALILTRIAAIHERTIEVHSTLFDAARTPHVTAQGIFHRLTEDQLERFRKRA